jgi:hypothetical protein
MSSSLEAAQLGTDILLGLGSTLVALTGIFVIIRVLWDKRSTGRLNVDDYLSVAAVVLLAATQGIFYTFLKGKTTLRFSVYTLHTDW